MTRDPARIDRRGFLLSAGGVAATMAIDASQAMAPGNPADAAPPAPTGPFPAGPQAYRVEVPKRPAWPDGATTIFCVTVHIDGPGWSTGRGFPPLGSAGNGSYSVRRGMRRALDLLERHGIRATWMIPGYDALVSSGIIREVHKAGHELCGHGYYHMPGDGATERLERAHAILTDIAGGEPPVGWCNPGGSKLDTTLATLKRLGYRYDASEKDDDLPYLATIDGTIRNDFLIIPNNTLSIDDIPQYEDGLQTPDEVLRQWTQELEAIHATTGFVHLSYHTTMNGSGPSDRTAIVDALIRHTKALPRIKFMRLRDLADSCFADPARWRLDLGQNGA